MNAVQLIGQVYDPEYEMRIYFDEARTKTPRLDFTLVTDRPKSKKGVTTLSYVGCTIGGDPARWFLNHVSHGDVVALDGVLDSQVVTFKNGKQSRVELRVVVTHLNWVGSRRKKKILAGTEAINLGGVGVKARKGADPTKRVTVVEVPDVEDDGQYDELPDWTGGVIGG